MLASLKKIKWKKEALLLMACFGIITSLLSIIFMAINFFYPGSFSWFFILIFEIISITIIIIIEKFRKEEI